MRPDAWAIRRTYERGIRDLACRWAKLPLFDLTAWCKAGQERVLRGEEVEDGGYVRDCPKLTYPPFDEFSVVLSSEWVVVFCRFDGFDGRPLIARRGDSETLEIGEGWIVVAAAAPDVFIRFLLDNTSGAIVDTTVDGALLPQAERHFGLGLLNAALAGLHWFFTRPQHPVVVVPRVSMVSSVRKSLKLKPWTFDAAPHVILLDPQEARNHGYGNGKLGGTHATPRLHQRRGHWHTLQHSKYRRNEDGSPRRVWTRPGWVGEREWEYRGNTYKVLSVGFGETP